MGQFDKKEGDLSYEEMAKVKASTVREIRNVKNESENKPNEVPDDTKGGVFAIATGYIKAGWYKTNLAFTSDEASIKEIKAKQELNSKTIDKMQENYDTAQFIEDAWDVATVVGTGVAIASGVGTIALASGFVLRTAAKQGIKQGIKSELKNAMVQSEKKQLLSNAVKFVEEKNVVQNAKTLGGMKKNIIEVTRNDISFSKGTKALVEFNKNPTLLNAAKNNVGKNLLNPTKPFGFGLYAGTTAMGSSVGLTSYSKVASKVEKEENLKKFIKQNPNASLKDLVNEHRKSEYGDKVKSVSGEINAIEKKHNIRTKDNTLADIMENKNKLNSLTSGVSPITPKNKEAAKSAINLSAIAAMGVDMVDNLTSAKTPKNK